jgi:hypothetical protein
MNNNVIGLIDKLSKNLDKRYDEISTTDSEKIFFIGIADYVQYIVNEKILGATVSTFIIEEKKEDFKNVLLYGNKSLEEMDKVRKKLFEYIDNKIKNPSTALVQTKSRLENDLKRYQKGIRFTTMSKNDDIHLSLEDIIEILFAEGHRAILKKYIEIGKDGEHISKYTFSPSYSEYRDALEWYLKLQERKAWGAWDKLCLVYRTVYKSQDEIKQMRETKDIFGFFTQAPRINEMDKILDNEEILRQRFKISAYKFYFSKVHYFLIDKLNEIKERLIQKLPKEAPKDNLNKDNNKEQWYAPELGIGFIKGRKFKLTEGHTKFKLFNEVVKNQKITREKVLAILNLDDDKNNTRNRTDNTYEINGIVKELRKTTHLDKTELTNNGGTISLLTEIKLKSPNITQRHPT